MASAAALLLAATGAALGLSAGVAGLLYPVLFVAAAGPGIPVGLMLFGRHHPAAWVAGGLIGYGLTQLTLWAVIAIGWASAWAFVGAWLLLLMASWSLTRLVPGQPAIAVTRWSAGDIRLMLLVLVLVPVLMGMTYRNLGRQDSSGNRYYRAYFTADFVWHSALAYELGRFSLPPTNPYLAPRTMNYYWTYFLLPATTAALAPPLGSHAQDVQDYLKANAILVGLLMVGMLFILVRSSTASGGAAAAAVVLAIVAASAEGAYAIVALLQRGAPLSALQDLNVDAVTGWAPFNGLRVDNIPRSLWYTPQHTTSIALGLAGLTTAVLGGAAAPPAAIVGAGLALGLATTMNPLLGAVCSMIYGVCVLADGIARPNAVRSIARHAVAALFVLAAVAWGAASRVMEGAGSALHIGFAGFARNSPFVTLLLSLGPILVPAAIGVLPLPRESNGRRAIAIGVAGIAIGLFLLYFVRISEASWVGFRAGQVLLVSIPVLLARTFDRLPRVAGWGLVAAIGCMGLPTTIADTYNAQDIWNRRPGPGFRWTLWTTPAQEHAFAWVRANTPQDAVVQMEPMLRGREHWTLIPSFAGRRMAAGLPISLLPMPEYTERSAEVRRLFATPETVEAISIARKLQIDYLYVDREDDVAYPAGVRKFEANPQHFERVYGNYEVRIYKVR